MTTDLPRSRSPRRATLAAVLGGLALLFGVIAGSGSAAASATSAPPGAWLRLAHFSPDTPQVDVYLSSFSAPDKPTVFRGVGYGTLSPYQRVPVGRYTVGMRLAGAKPDTPVVISTPIAAEAGQAYTVAGVGKNAALTLQVFHDDLSTPAAGQARLRVIQAADRSPVVDVSDAAGPLAQGTRFATTSAYVNLPAGNQSLVLDAGPGSPVKLASTTLDAVAGQIYSLVVLDQGTGVEMVIRDDAAGTRQAPRGGVATGLGGLRGAHNASGADLPASAATLALFAAAAWVVVRFHAARGE